ncbi:MAG TPA: ATP-binding protein, partial [Alphaproteobacteria bacterium]|nr:ATP-binding protein [Alphaproteobacteria bacterium]
YLDRLGRSEGEAVRSPRPTTDLGRAVIGTVSRLQRGWRARSRRMTAQVAEASAVLQALHDPLVVIDARRIVVRANDAAFALFDAKMVGRDLAERLRHPAVLALVDAVLKDGGARAVEFVQAVPVERVFEVRVVRFESGQEEEAELGAEGEGAPAPGALITFHDITAIKRSEQMRADFVANASHELRTPLSTLTGFIETLRGPARDDPAARDRFLSIMHEQAGRMSRLVADLLSLSRIELDEHTPPTTTVDLVRVLRSVFATLEIKAGERDLALCLEGPQELPPVTGDDDQLTQVFQNLIDNAINYTRPGTEVVVTITSAKPGPGLKGPAVAVAVRDHGDGIDKAHLPRLTERFYRVDPARSRAMGGTGLGLAIVKHIVSRHRGRLLIESEPGEGSTFTVILPTAGNRPARGGAKIVAPVTKA